MGFYLSLTLNILFMAVCLLEAKENEPPSFADKYDAIVIGAGLPELTISSLLTDLNLNVLHISNGSEIGGDLRLSNSYPEFTNRFNLSSANHFPGDTKIFTQSMEYIPKLVLKFGRFYNLFRHKQFISSATMTPLSQNWVFEAGKHIRLSEYMNQNLNNFLNYTLEKWERRENFSFIQVYNEIDLDNKQRSMVRTLLGLLPEDDYKNLQTGWNFALVLRLYHVSLKDGLHYMFSWTEYANLYQRLTKLIKTRGTFSLGRQVGNVVMDSTGKATGVIVDNKLIKASEIYSAQEYVPEFVVKSGHVAQAVCLLNSNITSDIGTQIIMSTIDTNRTEPVFLTILNANIEPSRWALAVVSTKVETDNANLELQVGIDRIAMHVHHCHYSTTDTYELSKNNRMEDLYVTSATDGHNHLENIASGLEAILTKSHPEFREIFP